MEEPARPSELPPIPESLHSAYEEGPFRACSACGADLLGERAPYQIQKTWRGREVVFEMALCMACAARCIREFSQESLERMQAFFRDRYREDAGEDACRFCGTPVTADGEFEIGAACVSDRLLRPPVLACAACNAAAQEGLSRKTRDAWGEFIRDNFPGVPESMSPETVPMTF